MITNAIIRLTLVAIAASGMVSCASFEHPTARHDMDGDGFISDGEYRQNHMQYDMARVQRRDEYERANLVTSHIWNANSAISGVNTGVYQLKNFGSY